jgi:hypothetical protein
MTRTLSMACVIQNLLSAKTLSRPLTFITPATSNYYQIVLPSYSSLLVLAADERIPEALREQMRNFASTSKPQPK